MAVGCASSTSTGGFSLWFGPLFLALRCDAAEDIRLAVSSSFDLANTRELLLSLRALPVTIKEHVKGLLPSVHKELSVRGGDESRLSVLDISDLLEHCPQSVDPHGDASLSTWSAMFRSALAEEGCKGDIRLLMSLLASDDEVLQCCVERLCKCSEGVGSPTHPSSPSSKFTTPPHAPPVAAKRPLEPDHRPTAAPPTSLGRRVEPPLPRVPVVVPVVPVIAAPIPAPPPPAVPIRAPQPPSPTPGTSSEVSSGELSSLLWHPPSVCSAAVAAILAKARGSDPKPPGPLDPQHPQRVMESTPTKLVKRMMKDPSATGFFADLKYDGERLIGFREEGAHSAVAYKFFSRNMLPVPDRKLDGIRELLDAAFSGHDVVFDAEILSMHTFGSMNEVHKGIISVSGPRIYVFDLLWWNGHSLVSLPLTTRKELLHRILHVTKNVTMSTCYWITQGPAADGHLQLVFDDAMSKRLEGYVLKPATSFYRYNGTDWVKLKKGYMAGDPDRAGVAGFVLFPGGPRIRRIDGVDVTTLAHGGGGPAATAAAALRAPTAPSTKDTIGTAPAAAAVRGGGAPGDASFRLFTALVDTIDCLAVGVVRLHGRHAPPSTLGPPHVLLGVHDPATNRIVTVGIASDPNVFCRLLTSSLASTSPVTSPTIHLGCGATVLLQPKLLSVANIYLDPSMAASSLQVLEVSGRGLLEDPQHTCACALTRGCVVARPRDDKSLRSANTMQQVLKLFSYAVPTPMAVIAAGPSEGSGGGGASHALVSTPGFGAAVNAFNDQHWCALPPPIRIGTPTPTCAVVQGAKASAAIAAKDAAHHAASGVVQVVLTAVAARSRWVDKGTMRDVSTAFGAVVGELCNTRLAVSSASSGDVAVVAPTSGVLCFVAAVMQLVSLAGGSKSAVLEDATVLDITLVRVFGFLASLAARSDASQLRHVVVHVDASTPSELTVWRSALDAMIASLVLGGPPTLKVEGFVYQRFK